MNSELFHTKLRQYYEEAGDIASFDDEYPILEEASQAISNEISSTYEMIEPIGRGGASIVIKVRHRKTGLDYALKLPRPRGDEILDTVKQEMKHLVSIRHENIIAIHDLGEVPIRSLSYPYFVMDYIQDAIHLRKRLEQIIDRIESSKDISVVTKWVADKVCGVARALNFLHMQKTIHFDIKPNNIFINLHADDRPILADLGYAKKLTESEDEVVVGFTLFYAHTELAQHYLRGSSPNRIRTKMQPKDFKYIWDIYALGKSLLELLALIDRAFPDTVVYDSTFTYLHLVACRMLDGLNLQDDEIDRLRSKQTRDDPANYKETWYTLTRREFQEQGIRYSETRQIVEDLDKLSNNTTLSEHVPELDPYFPHSIHVSETTPAPFTERVKKIVEHPVFTRLSEVEQLGFIKTIYPTATHTRLEHSLGSFRNCIQYIQALYNDPYSPLFKQLVSTDDIKGIILASMLHDLGYFPLAHDLEEISNVFDHTEFTMGFLENPTLDDDGHTIKDIIENRDWGWGIPLDDLKNILKKEKAATLWRERDFKKRLLSSIINGPIDVDKTDYLIRDSHECRLPYGKLIDYERLVRNLTIILGTDEVERCDPQLAIYEKGQSAAESLTFARYLMYQAVYWHHSSRAVRTMLREATSAALLKKPTGKGLSFKQSLNNLLGVQKNVKVVNTEKVLEFIGKWSDDSGKEMINLLRSRKLYKRILTIHEERLPQNGRESTWTKLQKLHDRTKFQKDLCQAIEQEFARFIASGNFSKTSLLAIEKTDYTAEILQKENSILVDIPDPSYGAEKSLKVIPEPQRLQRNYLTRITTGERISEVWAQVHHNLMRIAAKSRIYCHPDIRDTLLAAISPQNVRKIVDDMLL